MRDWLGMQWLRVGPILSLAIRPALAIALAALALWFLPARGAAGALGVIAGMIIAYVLLKQASINLATAILWISVTITADAAYARLNDQAPVTLANALIKVVDACVKLAEPLLKGLSAGPADPRSKIGFLAPDFVWGLILSMIVVLAVGLSRNRTAKR